MPKVPLPDMLADAEKFGYAIGYFEAWDLYSLEAVVSAAEAEKSPVIIGIGGLSANHEWLTSTGIDIYGSVCSLLAQRSRVPTALLFNEAEDLTEASRGLGAGFNAVMMHTQGWGWDRLIADTCVLVEAAHKHEIAVEGEVGALAEMSIDGEIDTTIGAMTEVAQAVQFVDETKVDCLAIAVGNVHFVTSDYVPTIDVRRIEEIRDAVEVPLVLHGGSGTPADQMRLAIDAGISKVNVGTRLKHAFGQGLRDGLNSSQDPNLLFGSRLPDDVNSRAAAELNKEVRRLMRVFGSEGRA